VAPWLVREQAAGAPLHARRGPHGLRRWGWCALVACASLALGATSIASGATVGPRVPRSLPALHRVAGWLAAGLKDEAATPAIDAQLKGNEFAWIPTSQCLATAIDSTNATPCVLGDTTAATTVVLLGDSSADQWALDLGAMGSAHGFRVVVYVHAACPVGAITVELAGQSPDPRCATFRSLVLPDLASMHPSPALVVVAELRLSNYESSTGRPIPNATWSAALTSTLEQIEGDGAPVLVLHGVPVTTTNDPAACIAADQNTMTRCTTLLKRADPSHYDQATWAGGRGAHAAGADVTPLFCTTSACPVVADGDVTHSEDNHVTELYAAAVQPALTELVGCALTQSFTHRAAATTVLKGLLGHTPSKAVLAACRALQP
jgi:SGNH domain (fused to AT3 domains)